MRIVILGQGGREQALAQACLKSKKTERLYVIPGNAGMKLMGIPCVNLTDENEIVRFCQDEKISLVIPGNEAVILSSIKSKLLDCGIACFSPDPEAAQLESSKIFCKRILNHAQVFTADFQIANDHQQALDIIHQHNFIKPLVLKADGLAQGKGVWVCSTKTSALTSLELLVKNFGYPLLFEDCLEGRELSAFAICNGEEFTVLGTAVDYKRITPDPFSANTGGMGAFSPCDFINNQDQKEIENIFRQTLQTLKQYKIPYQGFLFAGLMKTEQGMAVIEFNVRMGDPETQALLPRLNSDFVELILGKEKNCKTSEAVAVHVVLTSQGYPTPNMSLGHEIQLQPQEGFYFSGVKEKNGQLINSGGRVLGVTALAANLADARQQAYQYISQVQFEGAYFRKDIGL